MPLRQSTPKSVSKRKFPRLSYAAKTARPIDRLHYKDGSRSLRWSWSAPSTLRFNDFGQLMRSLRVKGAGVMLWIYNPRAVDADMRFSFETPTGEVPYRFDFHMDFTGWRACWIKYNDMPATTPRSRYPG